MNYISRYTAYMIHCMLTFNYSGAHLYSPVPMFPGPYIPQSLYSPVPMLPSPYVPQSLYSPVPMFPETIQK